jgi:hypothetical protein
MSISLHSFGGIGSWTWGLRLLGRCFTIWAIPAGLFFPSLAARISGFRTCRCASYGCRVPIVLLSPGLSTAPDLEKAALEGGFTTWELWACNSLLWQVWRWGEPLCTLLSSTPIFSLLDVFSHWHTAKISPDVAKVLLGQNCCWLRKSVLEDLPRHWTLFCGLCCKYSCYFDLSSFLPKH